MGGTTTASIFTPLPPVPILIRCVNLEGDCCICGRRSNHVVEKRTSFDGLINDPTVIFYCNNCIRNNRLRPNHMIINGRIVERD
jgi:hypothetical protein